MFPVSHSKIISLSTLLILVACSCAPQTDLSETHIAFEKGAIQANVIGELNGFDQELSYVIAVGHDQTMMIKQVDAGERRITLNIVAPNGEDVTDMDAGCNGNKTVSPTIKGDYKIKVFECMKADPWDGSFTLNVRVE